MLVALGMFFVYVTTMDTWQDKVELCMKDSTRIECSDKITQLEIAQRKANPEFYYGKKQ